jgi:hypothetical protein
MVRTSTPPALLALVFAVLLAGPFAAPAEAQDKSFSLPRAEVVASVQPDGSVLQHVSQQVTRRAVSGMLEETAGIRVGDRR